jgi:SAM-dependent methyltransferase
MKLFAQVQETKGVAAGHMTCKTERIYANEGNPPLIHLLPNSCRHILDVGCGAGDNAVLIKAIHPDCQIFGITHSMAEAKLARMRMAYCWVFNIEDPLPTNIDFPQFDVLIFSHVLEHLREPELVITQFLTLLREGGDILVAVPNILSWRMRLSFLLGRFEYSSSGTLDDTHLRFFTYMTADRYLFSSNPEALELVKKEVSGSVPLWWLRRYMFPRSWSKRLDEWGCRNWPNLFGDQVLLRASKRKVISI